jgi:hypothetical protein
MATAIINFSGKKYYYQFKAPKERTMHNIALAIAISKGKAEKVTKYTGMPKDYPLVIELLSRQRIVYTGKDQELNYFEDATQRTNEEKHFFNEQTQKYEVNVWRVGKTFNNTLVIDVDDKSIENLNFVRGCYGVVLNCKFTTIRTNGGYWLISDKKYDSVDNWKFDHCRVLQPLLHRIEMMGFIQTLNNLDRDCNGKFIKASEEKIKSVCNIRGNIDIMFTMLSIKRERSTLRISKKTKDDKIEVI